MSSRPEASDFFVEHLPTLRAAAALGPVVDLACGRGRQALAAARAGLPVVGVDRNRAFLAELRAAAVEQGSALPCLQSDLERDVGIPLRPGSAGAVLVFRYLHRPLAPAIERLLAPGGVLVYETFTIHQRELPYGPSNPEFLLAEGELEGLFPGLETVVFQETQEGAPRPNSVAQLLARRPGDAPG